MHYAPTHLFNVYVDGLHVDQRRARNTNEAVADYLRETGRGDIVDTDWAECCTAERVTK